MLIHNCQLSSHENVMGKLANWNKTTTGPQEFLTKKKFHKKGHWTGLQVGSQGTWQRAWRQSWKFAASRGLRWQRGRGRGMPFCRQLENTSHLLTLLTVARALGLEEDVLFLVYSKQRRHCLLGGLYSKIRKYAHPHFYRKYAHPFSEGSFLKILWYEMPG